MANDSVDYPSPSPSLASGQTKINVYSGKLADRGSKASRSNARWLVALFYSH